MNQADVTAAGGFATQRPHVGCPCAWSTSAGSRSRAARMSWTVVGALAVGLCLVAQDPVRAAEAGLYAIAGQPDRDVHSPNRIPIVLYRVEDGALTKVRTVATRRQGAVLVRAYREKGYVFVVSEGAKAGSFLVDILDLGDLSRQRSADLDVCAGCGYDEAHLLERDGRLIFYIGASPHVRGVIGVGSGTPSRRVGLDLASGEYVDDIGRADVTDIHNTGAQSGGIEGDDYVVGIRGRQGRSSTERGVVPEVAVELEWRLPPWSVTPQAPGLVQQVNNDRIRVLHGEWAEWVPLDEARMENFVEAIRRRLARPGADEWLESDRAIRDLRGMVGRPTGGERLVFDKTTESWTRVSASVLPEGPTRGFGRWLALEVWHNTAHIRSTRALQERPRERADHDGPFPTAAERFLSRGEMPRGRLVFYDTRSDARKNDEPVDRELFVTAASGTQIEHDTGDPDSEILLIDDKDVAYFRVGDELRRADLEPGGLANEEVIAEAPELLAVHWLVWGTY